MEQATAARIRQFKVIERPRLTRQLDACDARIILLIAPAGYGKTTLAREWLAKRPHAWFTATAAAADVAALATGVAHAMQKVVPGVGERMLTRLRLSTLPSAEADVFADMLAEDLATWPENAWLAVDDYQMLSGSAPGESFFQMLIQQAPIRVFVTSRTHPNWAEARSLMYGRHFELDRDDLAMTDDEARLVVESSRARRLAQGWPALLGLAGSVPSMPEGGERFDSRALHAFFAEEVFRSAPAEIQHGVCQLGACPDLGLDTAWRLLGDHAGAIIDTASGLGLVSVADGVLHLHPLIRQSLAQPGSPCQSRSQADQRELAAFLIQEQCWDEAHDVISHLEATDLLASLFEASVESMLANGRHATVRSWVQDARKLQDPVPPGVLLAEAELASREGKQDRAEAFAAQAARSTQDPNLCAKAWNLAGRSAHLRDSYRRAMKHHRLAEAAATQELDRVDALWGQIAAGWHIDPVASKALIPQLMRRGSRDLDTRLRIATALNSGVFQGMDPVDETADTTSEGLVLAEHAHNPLVATSFLNSAARWHVLRGSYREALRIVGRLMELVEEHRLAFVLPHAMNARALALIGLRDWAGAGRAIDAAEAHAADFEDLHNQVDALSIRIRLLLSRRDFRQALRVANQVPPVAPGTPQYAEFVAVADLARAIAGAGDSTVPQHDVPRAGHNGEVHALVLLTAAISALAHTSGDDALATLVAHIRRIGCIDPIVLGIRAYPDLLGALITRCGFEADAIMIAERIQDRRLAHRLRVPETVPTDVPLTKREKEVHELLAQGLSNREIAGVLFIEPVTVKVHVRHIYEKLGVRTRVEAATKFIRDR
jgi:LuxR family maltose regulon positive regulatory protein